MQVNGIETFAAASPRLSANVEAPVPRPARCTGVVGECRTLVGGRSELISKRLSDQHELIVLGGQDNPLVRR